VAGLKSLQYIEWPIWDIKQKPANKEFLHVKQDKLNEVMRVLAPYFYDLSLLDGFKNKQELLKIIKHIVKHLIAYIWDIPASQVYHHSDRFGLLKHSLEVAYLDAQKAGRELAVGEGGVPSAEKTKKERTWRVLAAWLIGLCHDLGKIFDIDLFHEAEDRYVYYHPLRGGVLDFRLKYPQRVDIIWRPGRGLRHVKRNMMVFFTIVPFDLLKQIPQHLLIRILDGLYSYKDEGDAESVKAATEEQNREIIIQVLRKLKETNYKSEKGVYAFALDTNVYAVVTPVFFQTVAEATKGIIETPFGQRTVENIFQQYGWVYCHEDQFYKKFKAIRGDRELNLSFALVKSEPFVSANAEATIKLKFAVSEYDKVAELLGSQPPLTWFAGSEEELELLALKGEKQQGQEAEQDEHKALEDSLQEGGRTENSEQQATEERSQILEHASQDKVKEQDQQADFIEQGLEKLVGKILDGTYHLGPMTSKKHIGLIGADGLLWLLYPRVIDENFDVDMNDNEARKQVLYELTNRGYLEQFQKGQSKFWFQNTSAMYVQDGQPKKTKLFPWIRIKPAKLIELNSSLEPYLS